MSISSLLEKSLDLIGAELEAPRAATGSTKSSWDMLNALSSVDNAADQNKPKTAASMLLEQKKQMKERMDATANINFSFTTAGPSLAPLVQQISTSSVEPPKYWNNTQTTNIAHKNHGPNKKAYSATKGGGGKISSVLEQKTKKALASINKGQDYHDRHQGKLNSKLNKQKLKNKLKN